MRTALIAGVSAVALALGGCSTWDSIFGSNDQSSQNNAAPPAYSSSSAAQSSSMPSTASPSQAQNAPAPMPQSASTAQSGSSTPHRMGRHVSSGMVKQAQQKLKDDGDYQAQVDGKFGPKTAAAVKQYQQKNGLKQTGRLDRGTLSKLGVGSMSSSGSSMSPAAPAASAPSSSNSPVGQAPSASPSVPASGAGPGGGTSQPAH